MKVYAYTGFRGHWPVGTSAVVVAEDRDMATVLLETKLKEIGLPQTLDRQAFMVVSIVSPVAVILQDGDY